MNTLWRDRQYSAAGTLSAGVLRVDFVGGALNRRLGLAIRVYSHWGAPPGSGSCGNDWTAERPIDRGGRVEVVMSILDHITLNVSDYARSKRFYEQALAPLDVKVIMEYGQACGMGRGSKPDFWLGVGPTSFQRPEQLKFITPVHLAFAARNRGEVDAFYAAAIAAGAKDFGAPGLRPQYHPNYYGAFVLDPDGHDIEAVFHGPA